MIKWIKKHKDLTDSLLILGGSMLFMEIIVNGGMIFGGGTMLAIGAVAAISLMAINNKKEERYKKRNRAN